MKLSVFVLTLYLPLVSFASNNEVDTLLVQKKASIELAMQNFDTRINDKVAICAGLDYSSSNSNIEIKGFIAKAIRGKRMADLIVLEYCIGQVWKDL